MELEQSMTEEAAPTEPPVEQPEEGEEQSNASPEEQEQYDMVMTAALSMIYGDQSLPTVVEKLASDKEELGKAIGHTAAMILMSIKGGVERQGREVSGDILFNAGQEVVSELIEVAISSKLMDESQTDQILEQALTEGMRVFGEAELKSPNAAQKQAAAKQEMAGMQGGQPQGAQPQGAQPQGIIAGVMQ
jgi:hypothetical protein